MQQQRAEGTKNYADTGTHRCLHKTGLPVGDPVKTARIGWGATPADTRDDAQRPGDATMLNDLKELLASLSGGRPLVVALLVIAICFLLLRPRRKQPSPPAAAAGAGSSGAAGAPQQKLPALSLSTCDILLEFVNGAPRLKQERRARTRRRPG